MLQKNYSCLNVVTVPGQRSQQWLRVLATADKARDLTTLNYEQ
jgi:hypothetical protein